MERDDLFQQAVMHAKEKDNKAARALLRNLLYKYPEDINALLLFSLVAENKESAIEALKQILQLDPDHDIAFAQLSKLKYAPPRKAETYNAPPPPVRDTVPIPIQKTEPKIRVVQPQITRDINAASKPEPKKKKRFVDPIVFLLLVIVFLCVIIVGIKVIALLFGTGI